MSAIFSPTGRLLRRAPVLLLLALIGVVTLGARCIDRTSSYVDSDGYTHITGEMVNDTDTQATGMMLQGTLYDAIGNVVASKAGPTCPPDSQPHQQTVFDLRFDNPNLPPWDHFAVAPVAGKALPSPLPDPHVVLFFAEAIRFTQSFTYYGQPISSNDVFLGFDVRNQTDNAYVGVQACTAVYDQKGSIVFVHSGELVEQTNGIIGPAVLKPQQLTSAFIVATAVPKGPVQVRSWIWFGPKGAPASQYQFVTTQMMTIQSIHP